MVEMSPTLLGYIADLVRASRPHEGGVIDDKIKRYCRWGAGPWAGQALALCAKPKAILDGRHAVTLEDIKAVSFSVVRHRILLNFQAEAENISTDDVITSLLQSVSPPPSPLQK